ncbi:arsenic resistance protein [Tepidibacter formicigenes]|jgi:ACR3 family arsenite efflux pump ArsB|uniref:Arsenite efflux pump ArsB, ACR3 family n=1 Tax=Tepidibacter formicigenes DSM 15518 TaxID=1123349 RepID=A0A1M6Q8Y4_9FIRM|nr:bile acid:sodium symporter [Tepidibacter formicigenes]SHK16600.1 Arsenite efflux pump ArsB, ACR3 family [Tepidibacter formicigenes DSM 15518]
MWKLIKYLQKKLIISIPLFMVIGLIYGSYFEVSFLKKLVMPFTILMVYPMMVNLNINELTKKGNLKLQFTTQLINFIFMPLIGFLIGNLFFKDNTYIVLGLLLTSLLPTSGMTISWTGFAKGNISEAIKMTIIGLILGSILSPLYLKYFMGTAIQIPLANIFKQILMVVFLPMIAGIITKKVIILKCGQEKYNKEYKQKFPPLSTLGVLAMVFTAMALKAKTIMSNPMVLINLLLPLILLYLINFVVSTIIAKLLFDKKDAIALIYGTVMRNLSIALAIAMAVFKESGTEIALIIAIAYIVQVQAGAWYVKFTDRILGV